MSRQTTLRAVAVGISILVLAQVMYLGVLVKVEHHELLRVVLLFSPGVAAFATAFLAPTRKFLAGVSMAVWGTAIALLAAAGYELLGLPVDSIGGPVATMAIVLAYYSLLSILGGAVGHVLSRNRTAQLEDSASDGSR